MKASLFVPPWGTPELTDAAKEAIDIIRSDIWKEASIQFYAQRDSKTKAGKNAPKGMQRFLNDILQRRFHEKGWEGEAGYFIKDSTWVRITFRHQMSLGSDIVDALKVCKKQGVELAIILAANRQTLNIISPNDASALVSFEKLYREVWDLDGAVDIPLVIGELTPLTQASNDINKELFRNRPRDVSVPVNQLKNKY